MAQPFNFAQWLGDDGFSWNREQLPDWSDRWPGTLVPFYSPKNFSTPFRRFSSPLPGAPIPSVNHSGRSFMHSDGTNCNFTDSTSHSRPDNFALPLSEWKSAPHLQSPGSFRMEAHQAKSFENYWSPLPPPSVIESRFQDWSPSPCGSSMSRLSCSPSLSDDSGYSEDFDSSHSPFRAESPLQFTGNPTKTELRKLYVRIKRKADEDHHLSPCQPKRKRVECFSNGHSRPDVPAPLSLPYRRANPPVVSLCIHPLQRDLDVICRSIIEVLLSYVGDSDVGSQSLTRDAIVSRMKSTSAYYSKNNLALSEMRQDFSSWQTRWGYMYMYMMRHAHLVFYSLKQIHLTSKTASPIAYNNWNISLDQGGLHTRVFLQKCQQPGGILTVCAIGGGPGSDLIGLALFLRANQFPVKISAHVFDKCMDWEKSWRDLFEQLPPYITDYFESVTFTPFDYFKTTIPTSQAEVIRKADLVTIVKSLSAVATKLFQTKHVNRGSSGLFEILSTVTSACVVLYLDNKAGMPGKVFQQTVKKIPRCQYTMIYYEVSQVQLPSDGFSLASRRFMDWVSYGPSFSSGTNEIVALARKWPMEF